MGKIKIIILILVVALGGLFVANLPSSDKDFKKKNTALKNQIQVLTNLNSALKEQNTLYENSINSLTEENEAKDATISDLQSQIEDLQSQLEQSGSSGDSGESEVITDLSGISWILKENYETKNNSLNNKYDLIVNFDGQRCFEDGIQIDGTSFSLINTLSLISNDMSYYYVFFQNPYEGNIGWNKMGFDGEIIEKVNSTVLTIVGGEDATNSDVIAWFVENAVMQEKLTDLTNTTWVFKDTVDVSLETGNHVIEFTSDGEKFKSIKVEKNIGFVYSTTVSDSPIMDYTYNNSEEWLFQAYKTITITGGQDVTNSTLIDWLYENAYIKM